MKYSKVHKQFNAKFLLIGFFLLFVIFFAIVKSTTHTTSSTPPQAVLTPSCVKIPSSLADTIIHYTTSNTTPQQTIEEISVAVRVLERKSPCNFLVFGLGHDSPMWAALNHEGRTIFLEEDEKWIETMREKFPALEVYHVEYDTKLTEADGLMEEGKQHECTIVGNIESSECRLALKGLPSVLYEEVWDVVMIDAPTGWFPEAPGRMGTIYTVGMVARGRKEGETDVFVHDVDRVVEDKFSKEFLCAGYMKEQEGRLRHFNIPSHRSNLGMPFCPQKEE